jgi:hypothetical protein
LLTILGRKKNKYYYWEVRTAERVAKNLKDLI